MALSKLEKAMATYILGFTPAGRKALQVAFIAAVKGGQMAGRVGLPLAARAAPPVARAVANPYVGVPLGLAAAGYGSQQYFEESGIQEDVNLARDEALRYFSEDVPKAGRAFRKRRRSVYNQAMAKAMAAVKKSTKGGPKGKLTNAKKTFGTVSKAVSRAKKGGKLSPKGITGVIKRSISGMFKPKAKRRTSSSTTYTFRKD